MNLRSMCLLGQIKAFMYRNYCAIGFCSKLNNLNPKIEKYLGFNFYMLACLQENHNFLFFWSFFKCIFPPEY